MMNCLNKRTCFAIVEIGLPLEDDEVHEALRVAKPDSSPTPFDNDFIFQFIKNKGFNRLFNNTQEKETAIAITNLEYVLFSCVKTEINDELTRHEKFQRFTFQRRRWKIFIFCHFEDNCFGRPSRRPSSSISIHSFTVCCCCCCSIRK